MCLLPPNYHFSTSAEIVTRWGFLLSRRRRFACEGQTVNWRGRGLDLHLEAETCSPEMRRHSRVRLSEAGLTVEGDRLRRRGDLDFFANYRLL